MDLPNKQLEIRLQTSEILKKIELYLRGKRQVEKYDGKTTQIEDLVYGEPMANELGIQSIMSFVELLINPHAVQGNFTKEAHYHMYVSEVHEGLIQNIMINRDKWNIEINQIGCVVDAIMNFVQPFYTRLINNKERESYTDTMRSVETNTLRENQQQGIFSSMNPFKK